MSGAKALLLEPLAVNPMATKSHRFSRARITYTASRKHVRVNTEKLPR